MKEIEWYFPKDLNEVPGLFAKGIPHAGGTSILHMNMNRISGLIELRKLPLDYFKTDGSNIQIGALQTYNDVVKNTAMVDPEHILVKALSESASESLRNRITVGGSVATFHPWSDIMGPLLALEAEVFILGKHEGYYPIIHFVENSDFRRGVLIKEVSFRTHEWLSWYHRETRTSFDYAIFTITILIRKIDDDIKIFIVGTKKKFMRLSELEESIRNKNAKELDISECVRKVKLDFPPKQHLSPDYIAHLARVQLERGLGALLRR